MKFPDRFKKIWWALLLIIGFIYFAIRLSIRQISSLQNFDTIILIAWLGVVFFPLIQKFSFYGMSIEKELDEFKSDLKSEITQSINLTLNPQLPNQSQATSEQLEQKISEDLREDIVEGIIGDLKEKIGLEIKDDESDTEKEILDKKIQEAQQFEQDVLDYLEELFDERSQFSFSRSVELQTESNPYILDGLLFRKEVSQLRPFIFELKLAENIGKELPRNWVDQMKTYMKISQDRVSEEDAILSPKGIFIIPASSNYSGERFIEDEISVFEFDREGSELLDSETFLHWMQ